MDARVSSQQRSTLVNTDEEEASEYFSWTALRMWCGDASSLYDANDTDEDTIDRLDDEIESLKHR